MNDPRPGSQRPAMPAAQAFFGFSKSLKCGVVFHPFSQSKGSKSPIHLEPQALSAGSKLCDPAFCQFALAKLYLADEIVPTDKEEALYWLKKAVALENQYAQYQLGKMLLFGQGIDREIDAGKQMLRSPVTNYIPFTEAQQEQARQTDLAAFLRQCGEIVNTSNRYYLLCFFLIYPTKGIVCPNAGSSLLSI